MTFQATVDFVRASYGRDSFIALHEPRFFGNEKRYLEECIDSTFVSSVGKFVDQFEQMMADYVGAPYGIATVNGTAALHASLLLSGVERDTEVLTQALTFVATCNAISYCGAVPVFVDVDRDTMGMSPASLRHFLESETRREEGGCYNASTGRRIAAAVPMHTFGNPCRIDEIAAICVDYGIPLIEDAAESLGSTYKGQMTGTFGSLGAFSFNGNKTITTGGGGMIIARDEALAKQAKHLTTTAKLPHPHEYRHDQVGYNYRLPNLNAALGCAQLEQLDRMLNDKRKLAESYAAFFAEQGIHYFQSIEDSSPNHWLNAVILENGEQRDAFLKETNAAGVMTRPIWQLMNRLTMFEGCQTTELANSYWLEERVVNIPSGVRA